MLGLMQLRSDPRMAGLVKRYHQYPTTRAQTVAEHSWHVQRIWLSCFATFTDANSYGKVLRYILFHDSGELETGDVPFPMKAQNPDLKVIMDRIESEGLARQGIEMPSLTIWERASVKVADLIEMAEFGRDEMRMGCQYGESIISETLAAVRGHLEATILSPHDKMQIKSYVLKQIGVQL